MSSGRFDPYYVWLGIPPVLQPPDHYRILGIDRFESDATAIQAAANRQITHLEKVKTEEQLPEFMALSKQVAQAAACLLDEHQRTAYETQLRAGIDGAESGGNVTVNLRPNVSVGTETPGISSTSARPRSRNTATNWEKLGIEVAKVVAGGLVGIVLAVLILWYGFGVDPFGWMSAK